MSDDANIVDDNMPDLEQQLEEARAQAEANMNGWKRAQADLVNFGAQQEKKNQELVEFSREVAVAKLLPMLDSLEQGLKHRPEIPGNDNYQTWLKGIDGTLKQLDKALEELGVQKIEALGKKFNPNFHEAVREVESEDEEGVVMEEYVKGYTINGNVVRSSQVGISKGK